MITRLFRNKQRLDSKDPDRRLAALESLSEDDARNQQSLLAEMVREDPELSVRRAALARLSDADALAQYLDDELLAEVAIERVMALVDQSSAGQLAEHPRIVTARLTVRADPALVDRLLSDPDRLIDAVLGAQRDIRADILDHPAFMQAALLQELERRSRDRDKATNRLARTRLDTLKKQSAEADLLIASIGERLDALEKPVSLDSTTEQQRRAALQERIANELSKLASLAQALAEGQIPVPELENLQNRWADVERRIQAESRPAPAATAASTATGQTEDSEPRGHADFDELTRAFETLDAGLSTRTDFDSLAAERQQLTVQWLEQADQAPPSASQHQVFEQVSHRFAALAEAQARLQAARLTNVDVNVVPEKLTAQTTSDTWRTIDRLEKDLSRLHKTLNSLDWPDWAPVPEVLREAQNATGAAQTRLDAWQAQIAAMLADLTARLTELDRQIDAGELKAARGNAGAIRKRLKALPERLAQDQNRQLGRASARLGELSDWQTFATTPKRESLLAAMMEIAETPLAARDQAQKIKDLRGQWNELGPVGRSEDHKLLEAFNEAAERAFEPCRAYFAQQAEARAANLSAREAICESLAEYLAVTSWPDADFKAAERILRTAREEWRRYHPVDRTPGKAVEARFESLQAELHQHIKEEWERNLEAKRQIVAEAQSLVASDDEVRLKVDGVKRLQQQWQSVGTTPRRPDQALWRDFRTACDAIFSTRDEQQKSLDQEIQIGRTAAEKLLDQFRTRLDQTADELDAATLREFQEKFAELPTLPERVIGPLERELRALVETGQQILRDQRSHRHLARLEGLKTQDQAVSALEQRLQAGESVTIEVPDPLFAQRPDTAGDSPVSVENLTRLTIEAEIAADLESAESDLRMQIQVEMMNAGRGRQALDATPEDLAARWCQLGPKNTDADPLRDRFFIALGRLLAR